MAWPYLKPLISWLVRKVAGSGIRHICGMYNMQDNYDKLQRQLHAIQAIIANAEDRSRNEQLVQVWLKHLRSVAYQAEDVLDDFQYEALRRRALDLNCSSSRFDQARNTILHPKISSFSHEMSRRLENVLGKMKEIITEMEQFNFLRSVVDQQPPTTRPPTLSCVIESDIIGRDGEKEVIINRIMDPNGDKENISVLPIVGMGGAGKTTLAQLVYNDKNVKECFKKRIWVCVSNDFNILNIVKSMIEQVATDERCAPTSNNLEVLRTQLNESLAGKKCLLVLDDIWNEEIQKWDALKTLLFSVACSGSVIIVTTRSKKTASIMGTQSPHCLAVLSKEDSWKLFQKSAFGEGDVPPQLVEVGIAISDKCAGLPLALKVIGTLMRTKREVHEWHAISENTIWDDVASSQEILPVLKLSYDQLSSYTKQCFAYCAMFPQDYDIPVETLIRLWMANSFIPDNGIMDLEEKGQCIFDELYSRCFFQDIWQAYSRSNKSKFIYCKMHDLMHELAKDITGRQCANMLEKGSEEVLHLALSSNLLPNNPESVLKEYPAVRTCLFFHSLEKESDSGNLSNSIKSTSLRALKMKCSEMLPMELGYMKHLRYLDLSWGKFDLLPESICTLYNLETLDLSNSRVSKLPDGMRNMIVLRHLILLGCKFLKKMPVGLGQLECLRTLNRFIVDRDPGLNIRELKTLNNLHGFLNLDGLENVRDRNEAEEASMISKTKISSLALKWAPRNNEEAVRNDQEVLEGLKPCVPIDYLRIRGYKGFDFPIWMKELFVLRNVKTLRFDGCINCTTLPPFWQLPSLERLKLVAMKCLLYICSTGITEVEEKGHLTFANLKVLVMENLDNLEGWHENNQKVAFPNLEDLRIQSCPKLSRPPCAPSLGVFDGYFPGGIQFFEIDVGGSCNLEIFQEEAPTKPTLFKPPSNVESMRVEGLGNVIPLEEGDQESCQQMSLRHFTIESSNFFFSEGVWKYFVNLETLIIDQCDTLSHWPEQEFRYLKCLKELVISGCGSFTSTSQMSSSAKEYGEDFLPRLEKLRISECPELVEIPNICSKSLKILSLRKCPSLSKEGLNCLKSLQELEELRLYNCEGLKSLPDGLEGLTSLTRLTIKCCLGIESFPQGLQQRLSQLQYLHIVGCAALVEHCRSGGAYQHLVAAIPSKDFTVAEWTDVDDEGTDEDDGCGQM